MVSQRFAHCPPDAGGCPDGAASVIKYKVHRASQRANCEIMAARGLASSCSRTRAAAWSIWPASCRSPSQNDAWPLSLSRTHVVTGGNPFFPHLSEQGGQGQRRFGIQGPDPLPTDSMHTPNGKLLVPGNAFQTGFVAGGMP